MSINIITVMSRKYVHVFLAFCLIPLFPLAAQPTVVDEGIQFTFENGQVGSVALLGDFNGWSPRADILTNDGSGKWSIAKRLHPGTYQYAFLLDGDRVVTDPKNSTTFQDAEQKRSNSVISITEDGSVLQGGHGERRRYNDDYSKTGGTVFLNLIWRYHQPWYYDAERDQITAPFVRIHATKDYYDMAAHVQKRASIHVTAVLSPSLLWQIENIYVKRLGDHVRKKKRTRVFDAYGFQVRYKGKTDPWIDLCLKPASQFTEDDRSTLYKHPWGIFSMPPVQISQFPQLNQLYEKWKDANGNPSYNEREIRSLKFWAIFAHFDPEFYEREIPLPDRMSVDFRDLVSFRGDGKYYLKNDVTEENCERIILDVYKVMSSIVPKYNQIKYNPRTKAGQIEIAGTSFFDAPLPLVMNTENAKTLSPGTTLPQQFASPEAVDAQLGLSLPLYEELFKLRPNGYIPPASLLSPAEIPAIRRAGYSWIVSDAAVLKRSDPGNLSPGTVYAITDNNELVGGAFGDPDLANRVKYVYRNYYAENAADDFIRYVLSHAPENPAEERLVTVVIEGESAWAWYVNDIDGLGFVNSLYRKLDVLWNNRAIVTTTMSEYIDGNRTRGIRAHPLSSLTHITSLGSGTSIHDSFDAWIGETETNSAWNYLLQVRNDLQKAGITAPVNLIDLREGTTDWYRSLSYLQMLAALDQNWFLRFSRWSTLLMDPKPYETLYLTHLRNTYSLARKAGIDMGTPTFNSFITPGSTITEWTRPKSRTRVTFHCTLRDREAITAVYIAGSRPELAESQPNTRRMWDNGEYGDRISGDNIWTLVVDLDEGPLDYKYTNSGGKGTWEGAEAFPDVWRRIVVSGHKMTIDDVFGNISGR